MIHKTILSLFLLLTGSFAYGQFPDKKKTTVFYINKENTSIKAEVQNIRTAKTTDKNITYTWYASNKIMETQGGYEGKLLHGAYCSFYLSNNLREKGKFKNGVKHGEWISWYENGKIQEITQWKKGRKCSWYWLYNEYGELMLQAHFKKGMLNGKMISYDGKNIISKKRYRNGKELIKKEKKVPAPKEQKPVVKKEKKHTLKKIVSKLKKDKKENVHPEKKKNPAPKIVTKNT